MIFPLLSPGPWRYITEGAPPPFRVIQDALGQEIANLTLMPNSRWNGPVMAEAFEAVLLLRKFAQGKPSMDDLIAARLLVARMDKLAAEGPR